MSIEKEILANCPEDFAYAWKHLDTVRTLLDDHIDALAVMSLTEDGIANVPLRTSGFDKLFGDSLPEWRNNFLLRVQRVDRSCFIDYCRQVKREGVTLEVPVTWRVVADEGVTASLATQIGLRYLCEWEESSLFFLVIKDVSKRLVESNTLSKEQYASLLKAVFDEIVMLDLDSGQTTPIFLNGNPMQDDEGNYVDCGLHRLSKLVHDEDRRLFWKNTNSSNIRRLLFESSDRPAISFDLRRLEEDGRYHWVSLFIMRIPRSDARKRVLVCLRNIDQQKEAQRRERELRSRAETDQLTGLLNRRTTEELISAMIQSAEETDLSIVAVIDVDNFKNVNDTYGHLTGDEVLQCVAKSIASVVRDRDIAGRIGGDEFVALFCGNAAIGLESIRKRLERCMDEIARFSSDREIYPAVTISIGLAPISKDITTYREVFSMADAMLYEAKRRGKNTFVEYNDACDIADAVGERNAE